MSKSRSSTKKESRTMNQEDKGAAEQANAAAGQENQAAEQMNQQTSAPEPTAAPEPAATPAPAPEPSAAPADQAKTDEASGDTGAVDPQSQNAAVADPQPQASQPPAASVDSVLREKSNFEIRNDEIAAGNNTLLKTVLGNLQDYVKVMGQEDAVVDMSTINIQQSALWRAFKLVLGSDTDFVAGMNLVISFIREHRDGAFADRMVFRGFEHNTRINREQSKAFQHLLSMLTTAADLRDVKQLPKMVDLAMVTQSTVFSDETRSRLIGFFH